MSKHKSKALKSKINVGKFYDSLDKSLGNGKYGTTNAYHQIKPKHK